MKKTILTLGLIGSSFGSLAFAADTMMEKMSDKMMGDKMMTMKCIDYKKATMHEVKKFQRENNIRPTGYVGKMTMAKLDKMGCMKAMMSDKMMKDDKMMGDKMMSKNIVATAVATESLSTLVAAVKAAGLVDTLSGAGPFTVFAPTNAAFAKLPAGTVEGLLKADKKADLTGVLTYHVVAGKYTADKITDGLKLKTVNGKDITFALKDGKVMINGNVMVQAANIETSNGVVHVIDGVLLP